MGRWCSTGRQARQARLIHMCNVSVHQRGSSSTISNKHQRRRRSLSILADGKRILDRQTLQYPLSPRCAQQWRMERTKGVRTSGSQGRVIIEVEQTRSARSKLNILCIVADLVQISISRSTLLPITPVSLLQQVRRGVRQLPREASLILLSNRQQKLFKVGNVLWLRFREWEQWLLSNNRLLSSIVFRLCGKRTSTKCQKGKWENQFSFSGFKKNLLLFVVCYVETALSPMQWEVVVALKV